STGRHGAIATLSRMSALPITRPSVADVIVIGGGPAGLYTALLLAQGGVDVIVLEEHPNIGVPTHCTGIVSAETDQLYKIPDDIVLNRPSACLFVSPRGRIARLENPGEE